MKRIIAYFYRIVEFLTSRIIQARSRMDTNVHIALKKAEGATLTEQEIIDFFEERRTYYFFASAKAGNPFSQFVVGANEIRSGNYTEAIRWIRASSDKMYGDAQVALATFYMEHEGSVLKTNYYHALKLLHSAAKQDNYKAQIALGLMHEEGKGVERNLKTAMYWYRKAAFGHRTMSEAEKMPAMVAFTNVAVQYYETECVKFVA